MVSINHFNLIISINHFKNKKMIHKILKKLNQKKVLPEKNLCQNKVPKQKKTYHKKFTKVVLQKPKENKT